MAAASASRVRLNTASVERDDEARLTTRTTRFSLDNSAAAPARDLVSMAALLSFVFPENLHHPLSTGRLLAFGLYGPLDGEGQLRAGHKGRHVVGRWELDSMCAQLEREDVLQVYILPGRPLASLSKEQQDELIAQADARVKAPSGKGLMPQLTRQEVMAMFDGEMKFHEMQRAIMDWRDARVQRLKVMFPNLRRSGGSGRVAGDSYSVVSGKSRRVGVSSECAPSSMFTKNKGRTNNGVSQESNKLLSTRAYKVCHIEHGNSPELTANVRLLRVERPKRHIGGEWSNGHTRVQDEKSRVKLINAIRHNQPYD